MKFEIFSDSLISDPLQSFLDESLYVDGDLLDVILQAGQLSALALRQQHLTEDMVKYIQHAEFWDGGVFGIALLGRRTLEQQLYQRFKEHVELLTNKTAELDGTTRKVLDNFVKLSYTINSIERACVADRRRLLFVKEEIAGRRNWLLRLMSDSLALNEPENLAQISRNVVLAGTMQNWMEDVLAKLKGMKASLRSALHLLNNLMIMITRHNTIRWSTDSKRSELKEFLAGINDSVMTLKVNNDARLQLLQAGYL